MEAFKMEKVLPHIVQTNKRDKVYQKWLETFDTYPLDYEDLMQNDINVPPKDTNYPKSFYEDEKPAGDEKQGEGEKGENTKADD